MTFAYSAGASTRVTASAVRRLGTLALLPTFLVACDSFDSLLGTNLPGQVIEEDLDNPALAETLVFSAQGDFECAFQGYQMVTGSWAQEFQYIHSGVYIPLIRYDTRSILSRDYAGPCKGTGAEWNPSWQPLHVARAEAASAAERIAAFAPSAVPNADFLIGKARVYEAYSTLLLSEAFCGIVFDGNEVVLEREEGFQIAADVFTTAIEFAERSADAEAAEIVHLAHVGRARARLNLGDGPGAVADASVVPEGFVYHATYDTSPTRRQSLVEQLNGEWYTVHPDFRMLTVDGVPDPRVPTEKMDRLTQTGAEWWEQRKFADSGTDIPFASWREAQLMIAEVEGGQIAVDVINRLRDTYALPHFDSADSAEIRAQVLEERRRELWIQGTKIGDDLRTGEYQNWDTEGHPLGRTYGTETCIPIPDVEFL
jgi:starch-binding outer membrane protein, SusD/RagB family